MIGNSTLDVARKYVADIIPPIMPGSIIHDNGCGVGAVTRAVLERYPEFLTKTTSSTTTTTTTIYATDINPEFIDDLKASMSGLGWEDVVKASTMPAENLSLADASLTHSFTNFLIFGARDPQKAASEAYRTLSEGGVAVMTTWTTLPHSDALDRTREKLYGETGLPHIKPEWFNPSHVEALMKEAGFERVEVVQAESGLASKSLDTWISMAWSWMGMPRGGWTPRQESEWEANSNLFKQECLKSGFEETRDGGMSVKLLANIVIGWKGKSE